MKEVIAVIRHERWSATRDALYAIGVHDLVHHSVQGRGRQQGLRYAAGATARGDGGMQFLPKRMVMCMVPDDHVPGLVETLLAVNQTGSPGDGKIFVRPVIDAVSIERVDHADRIAQAS